MSKKMITMCVLVVFLSISNSLASDLEKEKRWADQVVDSLLDGEEYFLMMVKMIF